MLFGFEMAAIDQRNTSVTSLEIVVFEVGGKVDLRPGSDGRRYEFRAAAAAQGYPSYRIGRDFAVAKIRHIQDIGDML